MAAINPRINVVFEQPLYQAIRQLAHKERISMSLKVRDLVKEALETYEDIALAEFAGSREKTFSRKNALTHKQVWSHLKH